MDDDESIKKNNEDLIWIDNKIYFYPYNPLNCKISVYDIKTILCKYGLPPIVNDIKIYQRAFIHQSYVQCKTLKNTNEQIIIGDKPEHCLPLFLKSNERLEFLGDGVLEMVTKFYIYKRFPKANPEFSTEKKIEIVKNEHIGKIAYEMGLQKWFIISKHAEEKKIRTNVKKLGSLFEAFIGALFLDFNSLKTNDEYNKEIGFQMVQQFLESIFEKHIDWVSLIQNNSNYKNKLQVFIQKEFKTTPIYQIIEQNANDGYTMGVFLYINGNQLPFHKYTNIDNYDTIQSIQNDIFKNKSIYLLLGQGQHKTKIKAEQISSLIALSNLQKIKNNDK
jgi:dsRNA-specific ribonuclease